MSDSRKPKGERHLTFFLEIVIVKSGLQNYGKERVAMRPIRLLAFLLTLLLANIPNGFASPKPSPFVDCFAPKKNAYLWIEAGANLKTLSSRQGIADMLDKAREAGITNIVPEAKDPWGFVLFQSKLAPNIRDSSVSRIWDPNKYDPPKDWFPRDYDPMQTLIEEAHKRCMKVYPALNIFSEGSNDYKDGPAFKTHPEWQSTYYLASRYVVATNKNQFPIAHVGGERWQDELVIYPGDSYQKTPTNKWGAEALVQNGKIILLNDRQTTNDPGLPIPKDGYVISGHGDGRDFILANLHVGDKVRITPVQTSFVRSSNYDTFAFVNAADPAVQNYEKAVAEELVSHYQIDGIVFDRARWFDYYDGFSDANKILFEKFLGSKVKQWYWPDDILHYQSTKFSSEFQEGPLWTEWQAWRAKVIHDFMADLTSSIRKLNPSLRIGNYVGGWYPYYWEEGLNWGAAGYDPGFYWTNKVWVASGIAGLFDFLMVGAYYHYLTPAEARAVNDLDWMSVKGVALLAKQVTLGKTKIVASLLLSDFDGTPQRLEKAIHISYNNSNGVMLFDLVYINEYNLWNAIKRADK